MINHSAQEEQRKEAEILERERKRLWTIAEKERHDKAILDYQAAQHLAGVKNDQQHFLSTHKFGGANSYEEAFAQYTADKEAREAEEEAARVERESKPFVLQQGAS